MKNNETLFDDYLNSNKIYSHTNKKHTRVSFVSLLCFPESSK